MNGITSAAVPAQRKGGPPITDICQLEENIMLTSEVKKKKKKLSHNNIHILPHPFVTMHKTTALPTIDNLTVKQRSGRANQKDNFQNVYKSQANVLAR